MSGLSGRQRFTVAVLLVAFIAGSLVLAARRVWSSDVVIDTGLEPGRAGCEVEAAERQDPSGVRETPAMITVHVCGAVVNPGVYALPEGSRVADAVKTAGGLAEAASAESVNMASVLADSAQVYIPSKDPPGPVEARIPAVAGVDTARPPLQAQRSPGALTTSVRVNINTATLGELDALPGIGPVLALRIIEFRSVNGRFERPEQLMDVSGIGPKKYAALEDLVTVY